MFLPEVAQNADKPSAPRAMARSAMTPERRSVAKLFGCVGANKWQSGWRPRQT